MRTPTIGARDVAHVTEQVLDARAVHMVSVAPDLDLQPFDIPCRGVDADRRNRFGRPIHMVAHDVDDSTHGVLNQHALRQPRQLSRSYKPAGLSRLRRGLGEIRRASRGYSPTGQEDVP